MSFSEIIISRTIEKSAVKLMQVSGFVKKRKLNIITALWL